MIAFKHWLICYSLVLAPALAEASLRQWVIVPAESKLSFTGTQNNSPVAGEFKTFNGDIQVDLEDLSTAKIAIDVEIDSLKTSYSELKNTLLSPDWFDSKQFPKARFVSTQLKKTGNEAYEAKGTLTIRNKSASVTLHFTAQSPSSNEEVVVGKTQILRSVFNVGQGEWASTGEIKDDVSVQFKLVARAKEQ